MCSAYPAEDLTAAEEAVAHQAYYCSDRGSYQTGRSKPVTEPRRHNHESPLSASKDIRNAMPTAKGDKQAQLAIQEGVADLIFTPPEGL